MTVDRAEGNMKAQTKAWIGIFAAILCWQVLSMYLLSFTWRENSIGVVLIIGFDALFVWRSRVKRREHA